VHQRLLCLQAKRRSKKIHIVPLTFTASDSTGKLQSTIEIDTDLGGKAMVSCSASATIGDAKAGGKTAPNTQARISDR